MWPRLSCQQAANHRHQQENNLIVEFETSGHRPERFAVGTDRIDEILDIVKNAANDLDYEKSLIEKAAYLVGGLAWNQAFSGANKRTAILTCILFLLENGYRLNILQSRNPELRQLLFDIQEERCDVNRETIDKIILYISKQVSKV